MNKCEKCGDVSNTKAFYFLPSKKWVKLCGKCSFLYHVYAGKTDNPNIIEWLENKEN